MDTMNRFRVEVVWNREFDWRGYTSHVTEQQAIASAISICESGDGARVKKARVIDRETDTVVWPAHEIPTPEAGDDRMYDVGGHELRAATEILKDLPPLGIPAPAQVKVLVVVSGGLVQEVRTTDQNIDVEVLDWDNIHEGDTFHDISVEGDIDELAKKEWPHVVF